MAEGDGILHQTSEGSSVDPEVQQPSTTYQFPTCKHFRNVCFTCSYRFCLSFVAKGFATGLVLYSSFSAFNCKQLNGFFSRRITDVCS